jgi:signal transduction histidine kinase
LFTEHFLYADRPSRLHRWVRRCAGALALFSLPAVFLPQHIMVPAGIPLNLLVTAYVTWCAFRSSRMKRPSAGYFLIAVFCSILLLPLFALTRVIPLTVGFSFLSFVFHYGVPMILLVEALLLSFALADRYRRLREDKIRQEAEFAQMLADEKNRINAELHDVIGSDLSLMRFSLGNRKKKPRAGDLQGKLDKTLLRLREMVALNNIEADLPAQLAHKLTLRSREIADATGLKLNADIEEIPLSVLVAFHIERFFAEALTNAARHAQASTIKIRFKKRPRYLILTVADDGRGMLRKRKPELTDSGLRNFSERAKRLDARFRIFTRLREGTVVALLVKDYGKK